MRKPPQAQVLPNEARAKMIKRAMDIKIAALFFSMAVLLIIASSYFFYAAASTGKAQATNILAQQCVKEFEVVGIKAAVRSQDQAIVSYEVDLDRMQDRVNASSVVIGRCAGYRLTEFCAGNGCTKPGIFFVLENL